MTSFSTMLASLLSVCQHMLFMNLFAFAVGLGLVDETWRKALAIKALVTPKITSLLGLGKLLDLIFSPFTFGARFLLYFYNICINVLMYCVRKPWILMMAGLGILLHPLLRAIKCTIYPRNMLIGFITWLISLLLRLYAGHRKFMTTVSLCTFELVADKLQTTDLYGLESMTTVEIVFMILHAQVSQMAYILKLFVRGSHRFVYEYTYYWPYTWLAKRIMVVVIWLECSTTRVDHVDVWSMNLTELWDLLPKVELLDEEDLVLRVELEGEEIAEDIDRKLNKETGNDADIRLGWKNQLIQIGQFWFWKLMHFPPQN